MALWTPATERRLNRKTGDSHHETDPADRRRHRPRRRRADDRRGSDRRTSGSADRPGCGRGAGSRHRTPENPARLFRGATGPDGGPAGTDQHRDPDGQAGVTPAPAAAEPAAPTAQPAPAEERQIIARGGNAPASLEEAPAAGPEEARRKEEAWARFYDKPDDCEFIVDQASMVRCGNHHIVRRREFEQLWEQGMIE